MYLPYGFTILVAQFLKLGFVGGYAVVHALQLGVYRIELLGEVVNRPLLLAYLGCDGVELIELSAGVGFILVDFLRCLLYFALCLCLLLLYRLHSLCSHTTRRHRAEQCHQQYG